jgi:hypothetical protein
MHVETKRDIKLRLVTKSDAEVYRYGSIHATITRCLGRYLERVA